MAGGVRAASAFVEFYIKDGRFRRQLAGIRNQIASVGQGFATAGRGMMLAGGAITGAAAAAGGAMALSLREAINLQEGINLMKITFKENADEVLAWGDTLADGFGIARADAYKYAGVLGNMMKNVSMSTKEAAEETMALIELGADLSSAFNIPVESAVNKLAAGLAGEAEPLRRLGINLQEKEVALMAERLGLAEENNRKGFQHLTNEAKFAARRALIWQQTLDIQGDFTRTREEAANALKRLAANTRELGAEFGMSLLKPLEGVLRAFNQWLVFTRAYIKENPQVVRALVITTGYVAAFGVALMGVGAALLFVGGTFTAVAWLINFALSLNPMTVALVAIGAALTGMVVAFVAIGAATIDWGKWMKRVGEEFESLSTKISDITERISKGIEAGAWIETMRYLASSTILIFAEMFASLVKMAWDFITETIAAIDKAIMDWWNGEGMDFSALTPAGMRDRFIAWHLKNQADLDNKIKEYEQKQEAEEKAKRTAADMGAGDESEVGARIGRARSAFGGGLIGQMGIGNNIQKHTKLIATRIDDMYELAIEFSTTVREMKEIHAKAKGDRKKIADFVNKLQAG